MRTGIVAITAAMAACLALSGARAQPGCAIWNGGAFFGTASAADVRACLLAGADPNARGKRGFTPLHNAAILGKAAAIAALLDGGADPGARVGDGRTPFDLIGKDSPLTGTPAWMRLRDATRD